MVLAWPQQQLELRSRAGQSQVYDPIRRMWLVLTPEEFIRQQWVAYLINDLGVPRHLMATERGITVAGQLRRFDLVIFGRQGTPLLLAECKHPERRLDGPALVQICQYNSALEAPWLVITNGFQVWCYRWVASEGAYRVAQLPPYREWE